MAISMKMQLAKTALAATFGLSILSCSSYGDGEDPSSSSGTEISSSSGDSSSSGTGNGDAGEGIILTYDIEDVTNSSFTIVYKWDECRENGVFEWNIHKNVTSYSINGTLSFWGLEFSGNTNSLAGIWTRKLYSAYCEEDDYSCRDNNGISKAVFTHNSITLTQCAGKIGEERELEDNGVVVRKRKIIDCVTFENTKGTETVRVKYSGAVATATYNDETCEAPLKHSESQMREACTDAYNKAKGEGLEGDREVREDYYSSFLNKDIINCLKDNNFPEWFH